jgi:hypothetical protein
MDPFGVSFADLLDPPRARREDGTVKGQGWLGPQQMSNGNTATELSFDFNNEQGRILAPLLVPTLTPQEVQWLLSGGAPTQEIYNKAIAHAQQQQIQNRSPFK